MGSYIKNMTFPMCNKFKPIILDGNLCYQLDVNQHITRPWKRSQGKSSGLLLVIDTSLERSVGNIEDQNQVVKNESPEFMDLDNVPLDKTFLPKVYIHTLSRYIGYGGGSYAMTSLKEMTGTDKALALPEKKKRCQDVNVEECQNHQFLLQSKTCNCRPFWMGSAFADGKVEFSKLLNFTLCFIVALLFSWNQLFQEYHFWRHL